VTTSLSNRELQLRAHAVSVPTAFAINCLVCLVCLDCLDASQRAGFPWAMDINKWLVETAEAVEAARKPDHPGSFAITSHPKKAPVLDLPFSKRRAKRRKVVSKDSSILAPQDIPTEAPARCIAPHAHQYSDCSVLSEDAGHPSLREDGAHKAANPYQRRKRHKTKADRYDPKPRSPSMGQQDGGKQKRKSTEKDKEARRSKKGKAAPSVIRNFHAANVPRERLTVRSL
jgi:hypothetical protein